MMGSVKVTSGASLAKCDYCGTSHPPGGNCVSCGGPMPAQAEQQTSDDWQHYQRAFRGIIRAVKRPREMDDDIHDHVMSYGAWTPIFIGTPTSPATHGT